MDKQIMSQKNQISVRRVIEKRNKRKKPELGRAEGGWRGGGVKGWEKEDKKEVENPMREKKGEKAKKR